MPNMIIIAGPNGSGKSTSAPAILQGALKVSEFVNADVIAKGLSAFQPEREAIRVGRIMIDRIHELAGQGADFSFETTLSSRMFARWISILKKEGYKCHLFFLWLNHVDLAVYRVNVRMQLGGHCIPEATIRRRYESGMRNFFNLYQPLLDHWTLYDNSVMGSLVRVASSEKGVSTIDNPDLWATLKERYSE